MRQCSEADAVLVGLDAQVDDLRDVDQHGAVVVDVGQIVYLRVESDEHRIGF